MEIEHGYRNCDGADLDPGRLDPAAKARLRTEGAVDGTRGGLKTEAARGGSAKEDSAAQK